MQLLAKLLPLRAKNRTGIPEPAKNRLFSDSQPAIKKIALTRMQV
jgi:hypothetical protein